MSQPPNPISYGLHSDDLDADELHYRLKQYQRKKYRASMKAKREVKEQAYDIAIQAEIDPAPSPQVARQKKIERARVERNRCINQAWRADRDAEERRVAMESAAS